MLAFMDLFSAFCTFSFTRFPDGIFSSPRGKKSPAPSPKLPFIHLKYSISIQSHAGNPSQILVLYICLIFASYIHNKAYFSLISSLGSGFFPSSTLRRKRKEKRQEEERANKHYLHSGNRDPSITASSLCFHPLRNLVLLAGTFPMLHMVQGHFGGSGLPWSSCLLFLLCSLSLSLPLFLQACCLLGCPP